ncbi:IS701 family transposase [Streptomyces sp. AC512_CC834]|uniref:IS701 family transposase n=1 Tax=Streptomyces sp. AC512_CC834 TaxID=2823691 RepID=UPI0035AFF823
MTHHEDQAASAVSIDPSLFQEKFDEVEAELAPLFARREPRAHAVAYVRGLLADLPRKNCWTLAEHAGRTRAFGMQRLLYQAVWDEDGARDAVRRFAVRHLTAPGAVLVFDETGQEKKGTATAGVGRQYTGTTGQVSNAVVAVYCTYASALGHCLIDGDLYVQEHWAKDPDRCERAGLGQDFTFRTKTAIALEQARRTLAAGVAVDWAAGDEVYGRSSRLRGFFEEHAIGYVFAVGINFQVSTGVGPMRADLLTARKIPKRAWNRLSCGQGAKGPRVYDWALAATAGPRHHLLVRRSLADPTELAFFYTYVPPGRSMALADLVKIAGIRRAVEEDFANGKDAVGLDHTQARRYRSWRRHVVLAMAALALLAVIASLDRCAHPDPVLPADGNAAPPEHFGQIALTVTEARRLFQLFTALLRDLPTAVATRRMIFHLQWSSWRRRHQARSRWHHYKRHLAALA